MGSDFLPFGILRRPHGTKGEILLHPYNEIAASLAAAVQPSGLRLTGFQGARDLQATCARQVPEGCLVCFEGISDRKAAAALVGLEVHVPRRCLAPLGAAEFYVEDIVGCEVVNASGRSCGQIRGTFWNGAQDVMVVVGEDGSERFYPVVAEYVLAFDGARRRMVIDPHE
jgi:16S rRNA processing protein RimM